MHSFVSHFPCLFLSLNASQLLKQSIATSRKKSKKPLYLPPSVASSRFPPNRRGTSKTAPTPKRTLPGHSASRLTLPGRFKKRPKSGRSPQVPTRVKVCETDTGRIRLSVSTSSRTYELSEDTYVNPSILTHFIRLGSVTTNRKNGLTGEQLAVGTDSRSVSTGPSQMFSVLTERCHVGYPREFVGRVYCTYGSRIRPMHWLCCGPLVLFPTK